MSDVAPGAVGIVVAHGAMAQGMTDAVRKISGMGEDTLFPLSNEGRSPDDLQAALDEIIGGRSAVIFTDLASGSCALAARVCCTRESRHVVINGVNLPMLLDFVFNRNLPMEELVPRLMAKGKESLTSFGGF